MNTNRPRIMGILNVTPDSFSDGGLFDNMTGAVEHGLRMIDEGADIIDIGGESTRPGAARISASDQLSRVLPVIEQLHRQAGDRVVLSIDTTLSEVADAAIHAGASMINDVSAGRDDPAMFSLAAAQGCPLILMHMQGTPATMQDQPVYENVVEDVFSFLRARAEVAQEAGVLPHNIIIDPGIGFGKTLEHNLHLLHNLKRFTASDYPVMLGASRKRFLKTLCNEPDPLLLAGATCATTVLGVQAGVQWFRVHDVRENRQAADLAWRMLQPFAATAGSGATLTEAEISQGLLALPDWKVSDGQLHRRYRTGDWDTAVNLVNQISTAAEAADHHPDIQLSYGCVEISLSTHSAGGITNKDFALAARIEQLAQAFKLQ